jgi:hypothetical protein
MKSPGYKIDQLEKRKSSTLLWWFNKLQLFLTMRYNCPLYIRGLHYSSTLARHTRGSSYAVEKKHTVG